jgi:hypothetical protein
MIQAAVFCFVYPFPRALLNNWVLFRMGVKLDRLYGLVVRVLGYRSGGPGSIPGTTRFSGKKKRKH